MIIIFFYIVSHDIFLGTLKSKDSFTSYKILILLEFFFYKNKKLSVKKVQRNR